MREKVLAKCTMDKCPPAEDHWKVFLKSVVSLKKVLLEWKKYLYWCGGTKIHEECVDFRIQVMFIGKAGLGVDHLLALITFNVWGMVVVKRQET